MLLLISYAGLRTPKVQTYITQSIAERLSQDLNTKVSIEGVDIKLFKTIVLEQILVMDLKRDTLLYVGNLDLAINEYKLDSNYIELGNLSLNNGSFHLKKYKNETDLNLQFLLDYFASADTSKARWLITGESVLLDNIHFTYIDQNVEKGDKASVMNFNDIDLDLTTNF